MALHEHPEIITKLKEDKNSYSQMFAQEVRRLYPFAPAMGAKVKKTFIGTTITSKRTCL